MQALYDLDKLAREAAITPDQVRMLKECVRQMHGSDEMLAELRLFRTLSAIRDGDVTFEVAFSEFQASENDIRLDEYLDIRDIGDSDRALVHEEVLRMASSERLIIVLYYYERLKFDEIALVLGISTEQVSRRHASLIERLRAKLGAPLASRLFRTAS